VLDEYFETVAYRDVLGRRRDAAAEVRAGSVVAAWSKIAEAWWAV
jgi:hypothetical protein